MMPARRRHYPGRGPLTGTAGQRAAYDQCGRCGHAHVRHVDIPDPGCTAIIYPARPATEYVPYDPPGICGCPGFEESEE